MKRSGLIVVSEEEVLEAKDKVSLLTSQIGCQRIRDMHRKPLEAWLNKLLTEIITDPPEESK